MKSSFNLSAWALKHQQFVLFLMLLFSIAGAYAYLHLGQAEDPEFAVKFTDVVGLYVDPPAHAVVLSIDEKSQIQALDRTQPGLPMM